MDSVCTYPDPVKPRARFHKKVTPERSERICARLLRASGFEKVTVTGVQNTRALTDSEFPKHRARPCRQRHHHHDGYVYGSREARGAKLIATRSTPVDLVDGEKLVEMFEPVNLGLKQRVVYELDQRDEPGPP